MHSTNPLYITMQRWTPFSITVMFIVAFSASVVGWFVFHGQNPPGWAIGILTVFATLTGAMGAIGHGVVVANGVAESTAKQVVKEIVNASSNGATSQETSEKTVSS